MVSLLFDQRDVPRLAFFSAAALFIFCAASFHFSKAYAAQISGVDPSKVKAGSGERIAALSYCAHWYARTGLACVGNAGPGDQVGVDAFSSSNISSAVSTCRRTGCKISLHCECASSADVARVANVFAQLVNRYGSTMLIPQVEVDGIRDISASARTAVAQSLQRHGFSLILKNMASVRELSSHVLVARVVYEDIVHNRQYAQEFKQLAQEFPNLLITGIVHEGGYDGDPGATLEDALQRFAEYGQFRNVELFYGRPSSYSKEKSFDGSIAGVAQHQGTIVPFTANSAGKNSREVGGGLSSGAGQLLSGLQALQSPIQTRSLGSVQPTTAIPSGILGQNFVPQSPILVPSLPTLDAPQFGPQVKLFGYENKGEYLPLPTRLSTSTRLDRESLNPSNGIAAEEMPSKTLQISTEQTTFISGDLRYARRETSDWHSSFTRILDVLRGLLLAVLGYMRLDYVS